MAGSGSRPLTNIPYCCLPQESGPCLSASVGDRPLRSPTHRRLGGPSPRLPSNGTHARPVPPEGFDAPGMPLARRMADYPAFPPATRRDGVGCIRVTHPSATLQDQTLRCNIVLLKFILNLGFRLDVLFGVPLLKGSLPRAAPAALVLCWPQTFKELSLTSPLCPSPLPFRKRVQKYYLFPNWQALFSFIFYLFFITLIVRKKNLHIF